MVVFLLQPIAFAHRLDEYLQATIISVENDRVQAIMRLIPGVAASSVVISSIDTNGGGIISEPERRGYAERVLGDLLLSVDRHSLKPRLVSFNFPSSAEMKEGLGEIQINFTADLLRSGTNGKLIFENHHQSAISVYLIDCLMPPNRSIQIVAQNRTKNQSIYQLEFVQVDGRAATLSSPSVGFASIFRLGVGHIALGTDHLLFLLTLLLPAPLIVVGHHWASFADVRRSVLKILRIVTAFTVGHSITLALAGFGLVHVPSRPIEVLIALSILVSAAHALHPLFPGREAVIAVFFGLIHGLAFASTIAELGLRRSERIASIFAFNLGIETMQLVVVAAVIPSLFLLSRTRAYSSLRVGGALFASFAASG